MRQFQSVLVICLGLAALGAGQRLGLRRRTTTSTTETPSLTEREANLVNRELNLELREQKFRERDVNYTLREESLRLREDNLAVREENLLSRMKIGEGKLGTPAPPDFNQVRYDKVTGKLVEIGTTDKCPENMRFFALPESTTEGSCDCDYHNCERPLLYSIKYDQCFFAWSQGPCESGEWYTYNDTLHPVCIKSNCTRSLALRTSKYTFQDPDDNECYETKTKGYCQEEGQTLLTTAEDPIPKCRTHSVCFPHSVPAQQECIAGNKRHMMGLCEEG